MALGRIKTRESVKDIKILDKVAVVSERMKTALVRSKDQAENLMDDGQISPSEYAEDKIRYAAEDVTDQVWHEVSGQTKKAIEKGKEAHREHRNEKRIHKNEERVRRYEEELRRGAPSRTPREDAARQAARQNTEATRTSIRSRRNQTIKSAERTERTIKQSARSAGKQTVKAGAKGTVKSTERAVKTAEKTSKAAIKTAEATAKATQKAAAAAAKAAQKAAEIARQTAIAAYKAAVAAAKAVAAAIKAIAAAMKALVAAIAAGGWVAVVVVVVICLVALIACSCFGIFFSSEDKALQRIMRDCNSEVLEKKGVDSDPALLPKFSCHVLRHTFATRMCESGLNVKVVQSVLGHADVTTTLDIYVTVTNDLKKREITAFETYLKTGAKQMANV